MANPDQLGILKIGAGVPVKSNAPHILGRCRVIENHLGPLIHQAAIVVPDDELLFRDVPGGK